MDRVEYLQKALDINEVQAELISELIADVPDHMLKKFLVFRMNYIQPKMSKELITKNALFDFRRLMIEERLRRGEKVFKSIEEVRQFLLSYYRGKDIVSGPANYYEFVVIGMDADGNLVNKFAQNEYGSFLKLNSEESAVVLQWLFENQHRIGSIDYEAVANRPARIEVKELEESHNEEIVDDRMKKMLRVKKVS
ncbi:MAG: hypothetical protein GXO16_08840 [Epsilonproteobacteria bacterium]|nr:hypothetical protein [Campylobacterota bacterium]